MAEKVHLQNTDNEYLELMMQRMKEGAGIPQPQNMPFKKDILEKSNSELVDADDLISPKDSQSSSDKQAQL